jgi:regulator of nucleoside diphosphate kinase
MKEKKMLSKTKQRAAPKQTRKSAKEIKRPLIISEEDRKHLETLINSARRESCAGEDYLTALEAELRRAHILPACDVPTEVVTMNSIVCVRDLESDEIDVYELVSPYDADLEFNRISVFAPIGTAILGYRVGDVIEWPVPAGVRRFVIETVLEQPTHAQALNS